MCRKLGNRENICNKGGGRQESYMHMAWPNSIDVRCLRMSVQQSDANQGRQVCKEGLTIPPGHMPSNLRGGDNKLVSHIYTLGTSAMQKNLIVDTFSSTCLIQFGGYCLLRHTCKCTLLIHKAYDAMDRELVGYGVGPCTLNLPRRHCLDAKMVARASGRYGKLFKASPVMMKRGPMSPC